MADFALIDGAGLVVNIVVADQLADVDVPDGQIILPVGPNAEIGGTHDGTKFVSMIRPAPPPPLPESVERQVLRALAVKIDAGTKGAVALVNTVLGPPR